jgi:hypothetical protein
VQEMVAKVDKESVDVAEANIFLVQDVSWCLNNLYTSWSFLLMGVFIMKAIEILVFWGSRK